MIEESELSAIEKRAEATPDEPWEIEVSREDYREGRKLLAIRGIHSGHHMNELISFFLAARSDIPTLVAEVRRLRARNEKMREALDGALRTFRKIAEELNPEDHDMDERAPERAWAIADTAAGKLSAALEEK